MTTLPTKGQENKWIHRVEVSGKDVNRQRAAKFLLGQAPLIGWKHGLKFRGAVHKLVGGPYISHDFGHIAFQQQLAREQSLNGVQFFLGDGPPDPKLTTDLEFGLKCGGVFR